MALERNLEFLNSLSKKERKHLDFVIKNKKNLRLKKMHKLLQSTRVDQIVKDKPAIFKAVFEEEYHAKKDYLLRNEIRLYFKEIKDVMVQFSVLDDREMYNYLFTKTLMNRGLNHTFKIEFKKNINTTLENKREQYAADYYELESQWQVKNQKYNIEFNEAMKLTLNAQIHHLIRSTIEKLRIAELKKNFVDRILFQFEKRETFDPIMETIDLNDPKWQTTYSILLRKKAETYQLHNEEKIERLLEVLALTKNIDHPMVDQVSDLTKIKITIGAEYMLIGDYKNAVKYFEQGWESYQVISAQARGGLLINYLSCLAKVGAYEKAAILVDENISMIEKSQIRDRIAVVAAGVLLLSGKIEQAEKVLPENIREGAFDSYVYGRLFHAIFHFENGIVELAENELKNLKKYFSNKKDKDEKEYTYGKDLTNCLAKFIRIINNYPKSERKDRLEDFKLYLLDLQVKYEKFSSDNFIFLWLKKQLNLE